MPSRVWLVCARPPPTSPSTRHGSTKRSGARCSPPRGFTDNDELFVTHTLVVVTAETIAHAVVGFDVAALEPRVLLAGDRLEAAQIGGVVEDDFFDWVLEVEGGDRFVQTIARRLAAFSWDDVEHDVMNVLWASVSECSLTTDDGERPRSFECAHVPMDPLCGLVSPGWGEVDIPWVPTCDVCSETSR